MLWVLKTVLPCVESHRRFGDEMSVIPLGQVWLVFLVSKLATLIHPPVGCPPHRARSISQYTLTGEQSGLITQ